MTSLPTHVDLLCRWLNVQDLEEKPEKFCKADGNSAAKNNEPYQFKSENEAKQHFKAYYEALVGKPGQPGPLLRQAEKHLHRARHSTKEPEDIVNEVFIKLLVRIIKRTSVVEYIDEYAPLLSLPQQSKLFQTNLRTWNSQIGAWSHAAMGFASTFSNQPLEIIENAADCLNDRLPPLRARGAEFLQWAGVTTNADAVHAHDDLELEDTEQEPTDNFDECTSDYPRYAIEGLFKRITVSMDSSSEAAVDAELNMPGGALFVIRITKILIDAPCLEIPLYLPYRMVKNAVIDHIDKKATQNEAARWDEGSVSLGINQVPEWTGASKAENELDEETDCIELENIGQNTEQPPDKIRPSLNKKHTTNSQVAHRVLASKNVGEATFNRCNERYDYEQKSWQLQETMNALLYAPVKKAEAALQVAKTNQERKKAQHELQKEQASYKQRMNILFVKKGNVRLGRKEIAATLGLTEDTVRGHLMKIKHYLEPLNPTTLDDNRG